MESTGAPPLERNQTLDGLKYLAAALIVLHHVAAHKASGTDLLAAILVFGGATALFFFFAVSGYLHGAVGGRGNAWRIKRFTRLAAPYAFWSLIYLAVAQRPFLHGGPLFLPNPFVLIFFAGAHGILWFLPMLLFCALICDIFVHDDCSRRSAILICVIATIAITWSGLLPKIPDVTWQNFIFAPRYLLLYLGGMEVRAQIKAPKPSTLFLSGAITAVSVAMLYLVGQRVIGFNAAYVLSLKIFTWTFGAIWVLVSATAEIKWFGIAKLSWGRDYLLGIYLTHILWLGLFLLLVPPNSLATPIWIIAGWTFCFTAASLTTWLLLSNKLTRSIVI